MAGQDRPPVYTFGAWEIDLARREMRLNGVPTDLGSRAFEIVETLVQSAGELIDKYDLMNRVWPGAVVEENTLQAQISAIRKVLGPDRGLLKTIAGRGYRLLARLRLRPTSRVECLLHSRRRGLAHRRTAYDGQIATCLPSPFILPLWGYRP